MAYEQPQDAHAIVNIHAPRQLFKDGKPAGTIPPYKHQAYPKLVYPKTGGKPLAVKSSDEEKSMLAQGYSLTIPDGHEIDPQGNLVPPPKVEAEKKTAAK